MSVTPSSPIVGVFRDRSVAEQAIDALYNAGFQHEQIQYSGPGSSGGFFDDLKSLFTGTSTSGSNLASDLSNMGLSDTEVQYYSNEYKNGNTILAVSASGREQEAMSILHRYGAYKIDSYERGSSQEAMNYSQQPADYSQQNNDTTSAQQNSVQALDEEMQPRPVNTGESTFGDNQQDPGDADLNMANETAQPTAPLNSAMPAEAQANMAAPQQNADDQSPDLDSTPSASDNDTGFQSAQNQSAQMDGTGATSSQDSTYQEALSRATGYEPSSQDAQSMQRGVVFSESDTNYQLSQPDMATTGQSTEMPASQTNTVPVGDMDELQQLVAQIQALQQQLQDAKAELQAAKERETQLKSAKEREQQLQAARQQLQAIQAELESTRAELQESQTRVAQ